LAEDVAHDARYVVALAHPDEVIAAVGTLGSDDKSLEDFAVHEDAVLNVLAGVVDDQEIPDRGTAGSTDFEETSRRCRVAVAVDRHTTKHEVLVLLAVGPEPEHRRAVVIIALPAEQHAAGIQSVLGITAAAQREVERVVDRRPPISIEHQEFMLVEATLEGALEVGDRVGCVSHISTPFLL
jgi:hypothetical protein